MNKINDDIKIKDNIYWIGSDSRTDHVFEGAFPIPDGISYNSYIIMGSKTVLLDSCDASVVNIFWSNLRHILGGRSLDYFVINHMEPDHGAGITRILETYPDVTIIGNSMVFDMLYNFYSIRPKNKIEVKDGDEVNIDKHKLKFIFATMVHWPEVMFTYDVTEKMLFSADAFGTFKALSGSLFADEIDFDKEYLSEARRYYSNIVGKYGSNVQLVFKKLNGIPIDVICPLHGPIWRKNIEYIFKKYDIWSRYVSEDKGVVIAYVSIYGNTADIVDRLATMLKSNGVRYVVVYDITKTHSSYVVSDVFRFTNIVFAAPTYNSRLHPTMSSLIEHMDIMAVQGKGYSIIENGSWAPQSAKVIENHISAMKNMTKIGKTLTVRSSLHDNQIYDLEKLVDDIVTSL